MYVGAMVAAFAFGALVASLFGDYFTRKESGLKRELELIIVAVAFVLVVLSFSMSLAIDMAMLALLGVATELTFLVMPNLVIIYSPREVRGRMIGLVFMITALMVGVGTYLFGYLVDSLGLEEVLIGSAVMLLIYSAALLSRPLPLPTDERRFT
jgi:MFS family permease